MWSSSRTISVRRANRRPCLIVNASVLILGLISQVAEELWEVKDKKIRNLTKVRATGASCPCRSLSAFDATPFPPYRKGSQLKTTSISLSRSPRLQSRKPNCSRRVARRRRLSTVWCQGWVGSLKYRLRVCREPFEAEWGGSGVEGVAEAAASHEEMR